MGAGCVQKVDREVAGAKAGSLKVRHKSRQAFPQEKAYLARARCHDTYPASALMPLAEGAAMTAGAGRGILECSSPALGREALEKRRVGAEFLATTMELALAAQDNFSMGVEGPHDTADLYILLEIVTEVADLIAISLQTYDREMAFPIERGRAA